MANESDTSVSIADLRREYETAVRGLWNRVDQLRRNGHADEEIARAVHAERRKLAKQFKDRTPEPTRSALYQRTAAVYGDPLGPSIETLRANGKTWEAIAKSAARPGPPPGKAI